MRSQEHQAIRGPIPKADLLNTLGVRAHVGVRHSGWPGIDDKYTTEPPTYWGIGETKNEADVDAVQRRKDKSLLLFKIFNSRRYDHIPEGTTYHLWAGKTLVHGKTDGLEHTDEPKRTEKTKPSIEDAIQNWERENRADRKDGVIVRGKDGKPVEIVLVKGGKKPVFAVRVNGHNSEQFQIGGKLQNLEEAIGNLQLTQFLHEDIFNDWYELIGVKILDADVSEKHRGFIFGRSGMKPKSLNVTRK